MGNPVLHAHATANKGVKVPVDGRDALDAPLPFDLPRVLDRPKSERTPEEEIQCVTRLV
jgi:hypothetical protein